MPVELGGMETKRKQKVVHLTFFRVDKPETRTPCQIVLIELDEVEPVIKSLSPAGRQLGQPGDRNIRVGKQARTAYAKATRALNRAVATEFVSHIFLDEQPMHDFSTNVDHYLSDHDVLVFKTNGR
jgi:hypothetical protein